MAIKGAVLGDILGSQYEFNRPNAVYGAQRSLFRF